MGEKGTLAAGRKASPRRLFARPGTALGDAFEFRHLPDREGPTLTSTAYRFDTAGSLDANPTLARQRASVALSVAPAGTTFLTRREGAMFAHYLVIPGKGHSDPINAAKTVAAPIERVASADQVGST